MHIKRIFIIITISIFMFAVLWVGQTTLTSADNTIANVLAGTINWDDVTKLSASDGTVNNRFGYDVATDGNTSIVGTRPDDDDETDFGSAYIIVQDQYGNWSEQAKLTADDGTAGSFFGRTVAIDGDTVVVGAFGESELGGQAGAAYIFVRSANNWTQQAKLTANDGAIGDRFGIDVSISGDTIVVGASRDDDNGTNSGSAYIFVRNDDIWTQQAKIDADDGSSQDEYGRTVSISNDTIVVGALYDNAQGTDSGSAYVYEHSDITWSQQTKLLPDDGGARDEFGLNVSIDGNSLIVGTHRDNTNASDAGSAYIFVYDGVDWNQQAKLLADDGGADDLFGWSVSIFDDVAVVGALQNNELGADAGAAYVFERKDSSWSLHSKLTAPDGVAGDVFGRGVSISQDTILIGADRKDTNGTDSGSVYFYTSVVPVDVAIEKVVSEVTAVPNQPITYTLAYTNNGPGIAFNTLITDIVPPTIVNPSIDYSGPIITKTGTTSFTWEVAPLALNESGTITITGIISPDLTVDTEIANTAVISNSLDITPTNNTDTAVVQVIAPKTVYLPIIVKPAPNPFPIQVGAAIPTEPADQGAIFYATTLTMPNTIPTTGQFYLSSKPDQISPIWVDDELAILLNGNELFTHSFAPNCQPVQSDRVTLPRDVIEQLAGESPTFTYRDVCGHHVGASAIWLIWIP